MKNVLLVQALLLEQSLLLVCASCTNERCPFSAMSAFTALLLQNILFCTKYIFSEGYLRCLALGVTSYIYEWATISRVYIPGIFQIQGVPKKIRLHFCLISWQPIAGFSNCIFLLKTEIHTHFCVIF